MMSHSRYDTSALLLFELHNMHKREHVILYKRNNSLYLNCPLPEGWLEVIAL